MPTTASTWQADVSEQVGHADGFESTTQRVGRPQPAVGIGQDRPRRHVPAGQDLPQHGAEPAGHQDGDQPARSDDGRQRGHHRGRIVDGLQQVVAQHQVRLAGRNDGAELVRVGLDSGDQVVDPGVLGAAVQDGQRVHRGIDDGHPTAKAGQRNRPGAASAAHVDDLRAGHARHEVRQHGVDRIAGDRPAHVAHRTPFRAVTAPPRPLVAPTAPRWTAVAQRNPRALTAAYPRPFESRDHPRIRR